MKFTATLFSISITTITVLMFFVVACCFTFNDGYKTKMGFKLRLKEVRKNFKLTFTSIAYYRIILDFNILFGVIALVFDILNHVLNLNWY